MPERGFKISLRENGEHSFKRGLETYRAFESSEDPWLLKEAIMFLHHGIELLMKEVLYKHSPYLIYEDIRELHKKQKIADEQGRGIFSITPPPNTVRYEIAIERIDAFIKPPELDKNLIK